MEKNILVAGASGALGLEILKLLREESYNVRALIFSEAEAKKVSPYTSDIWVTDASEETLELKGVTNDITTVISAMGKSVSLFTNRGNSFMESDFKANKNLITDALQNNVKRFIYVSIKGAEKEMEFEITRVHKMVEQALVSSGIDHTIIRPVGFFSGLHDLAIMAKRKVVPVIGDGSARTNSIHQKDLAKVVLENLSEGPQIIEVGGPLIHTRLEMAEMIKDKFGGKIVKVPEKIAEWGMILPDLLNDDISEKLKYFKFITTHDMIGEKHGSITFKEYLINLDIKDLP